MSNVPAAPAEPVAPRPRAQKRPAASRRQGLSAFDRAVLDLVDQIPAGSVTTYGSIAEHLGMGTPRLVARVMSTKSDPDTPWHRVLRSDGSCAPQVAAEQVPLLRRERVPFRTPLTVEPTAQRIDVAAAVWIPRLGG